MTASARVALLAPRPPVVARQLVRGRRLLPLGGRAPAERGRVGARRAREPRLGLRLGRQQPRPRDRGPSPTSATRAATASTARTSPTTGAEGREDHYKGYDDGFPDLAPVGSFPPNDFGLYDMARQRLGVDPRPRARRRSRCRRTKATRRTAPRATAGTASSASSAAAAGTSARPRRPSGSATSAAPTATAPCSASAAFGTRRRRSDEVWSLRARATAVSAPTDKGPSSNRESASTDRVSSHSSVPEEDR